MERMLRTGLMTGMMSIASVGWVMAQGAAPANPMPIKVTTQGGAQVFTISEGAEENEADERSDAAEHAKNVTGKSGGEGIRFEIQMEKATYLGVSAMPVSETLSSQLGIPKGQGLVVQSVDAEGPTAGKLQTNDILQKVNDQVLFNPQQFTSLVRSFKPGDEVTLIVLRAGKPVTVTTKLTEKLLPKSPWVRGGGSVGWVMDGTTGATARVGKRSAPQPASTAPVPPSR